jgi:hypothetical protein
MLQRVPIEPLRDTTNKSFHVPGSQFCELERPFSRIQVGQELADRRVMMFNSAISESSDVGKVLSVGGENFVEWFGCRGNRCRYALLAMQKAPQASHRVRDPTWAVTKESLALLELLGCQSIKTAGSATTEVLFDRSTSENVTLTTEESVSLPNQPLVEVIQNAT